MEFSSSCIESHLDTVPDILEGAHNLKAPMIADILLYCLDSRDVHQGVSNEQIQIFTNDVRFKMTTKNSA